MRKTERRNFMKIYRTGMLLSKIICRKYCGGGGEGALYMSRRKIGRDFIEISREITHELSKARICGIVQKFKVYPTRNDGNDNFPFALFNIRSICRRVGRNAEYGDYCMQI